MNSNKNKNPVIVNFGDDAQIIIPDEVINASDLGYFDYIEDEAWKYVKKVLGYMGIKFHTKNGENPPVSFDIAKELADIVLSKLESAGVLIQYNAEADDADSDEHTSEINSPLMNWMIPKLRKVYPQGTRIVLDYMDDLQAPPAGTKGTVRHVDDMGTIHVKWDTGSSLGLIYLKDKFHIYNI